MTESKGEKINTNAAHTISASFSCCSCLMAISFIIASIALGIIALKYAWAFLVWAWKLVIVF